ncbi:hypothetical protein PMAYCL1PPCAC_32383, partial [Pristionchus mayeri]
VLQLNRSELSDVSSADRLFAIDDLFDAPDGHRLDSLSPDCKEDMTALISAHFGKFLYPEFALDVLLPIIVSPIRIHQVILKGHTYFAGHYSECLEIDAKLTGRDRPFRADYFKVDIDILFRPNTRNDSCVGGLAVGRVIGWSLGLCLPASCSSAELESLVISDEAKHNPICAIHKTNDSLEDPDAGFYITISIMGVIFVVCLLSGVVDFFFSDLINGKPASRSLPWRMLMCFSKHSNVASIFDTSGGKKEGQISPIHCIRFFSMCWVVLGHLTASSLLVVANPLDIVGLSRDLTTEFILNAFFTVDSFFSIGGLLLTFLWFKSYHRNPRQTNSPGAWIMLYAHRILRLSPAYFMMVAFNALVMHQTYRNSPFNLNSMTQSEAEMCKSSWWLEFTYLQNFIDKGRSQCHGVSWYLATDTQIFIFTPLLILPLALKPILGFAVAAVIFVVSSAWNIFLVYHYHWPASLSLLGAIVLDMTNFENYMFLMYFSPITRCQVYIIGMLVGWFLQTKKRMRINQMVNIVLWMLSLALMLTLLLGLHSQTTGTLMPIFWRAMYSAFSKPAWALCLSWIIIACYYGYGGPINSFMSWHIWVPLGRLSYCGYLVHYPMMNFVLGQVHDEIYFSSFTEFAITKVIPVIALTYFASIFWSACFEIGFGKMEMLLLGGHRMRVKQEESAPVKRKLSQNTREDPLQIRIRL